MWSTVASHVQGASQQDLYLSIIEAVPHSRQEFSEAIFVDFAGILLVKASKSIPNDILRVSACRNNNKVL